MHDTWRLRAQAAVRTSMILGACALASSTAAHEYHPISPTLANQTIILTGNDLTIAQVIQVARYGAKVKFSPEAKRRNLDTFNLMNEGAAEGIPIYLFNRNSGAGREIVRFTGDPKSPDNRAKLEAEALDEFKNGRDKSHGPEFMNEESVRAMMVVRANQMTYLAASPAMLQALIEHINAAIPPVMRSRAGTGQAPGPSAGAINAARGGAGQA